jgi:AraC-like DNA-binding protein
MLGLHAREVLAIEVDPCRVHSALGEDTDHVKLVSRLSVRDPVLESLLTCMRVEVDSGCASGRLFAEGLSLSLLERLRQCYSGGESKPISSARKLSSRQLHDAVAFIDSNLRADLSLLALASQMSMRPSTFENQFKATVEETLHQFVLSRRLDQAAILLRGCLSEQHRTRDRIRESLTLFASVPAPHWDNTFRISQPRSERSVGAFSGCKPGLECPSAAIRELLRARASTMNRAAG